MTKLTVQEWGLYIGQKIKVDRLTQTGFAIRGEFERGVAIKKKK